jgi:hypothetical protein
MILFFDPECLPGEFKCTSGECILGVKKCDDKYDCNDGSDETGCGKFDVLFLF